MAKFHMSYDAGLRTTSTLEGNSQKISTDAPKELGGKGELFSPTDLLAVALGTCVLTLIGMAANKSKVDISGLRLTLDKTMAPTPPRRLGKAVMHIYCPQKFDPAITEKLETAAKHCPVHQSLHPEVQQEFIFHWGEP